MRLGLALSGGGVRGAAHLGVIKALEEHGLRPQLVCGTSAGALVAGFYAAGYKIHEIIDIAKQISWRYFEVNSRMLLQDLLSTAWRFARGRRPNIRSSGIIRARRFESFLLRHLGDVRVQELRMPFAATAVDINNADNIVFTNLPFPSQDYVIITDVRLVDALRASMAIPVVFTPKVIYGRRLVDGGLTNILPTDIAYKMGARRVIAVNLGYSGQLEDDVDNLFEIGAQSIDIMGYQISKFRRSFAAFTIEPKIYDVSTLDFGKIPECIERGYQAAVKMLQKYA